MTVTPNAKDNAHPTMSVRRVESRVGDVEGREVCRALPSSHAAVQHVSSSLRAQCHNQRVLFRPIPRPRVVRVHGRSMEPTLRQGDVLLTLWGARVRPGVVAVVRLPPDASGAPRPLSVKRVSGADPAAPHRWWIDSDNPREGVTSFDVGSLDPADVVAVVVARVSPRPGRVTTRHTP